ncbi:MAG: hypothetical protein K8L91_14365 [Anaerolineae bacterium]|nr:hypothetical protein [Anaerolineae bacterium]
MVAETKRRRKFIADEHVYVWHIQESGDPGGPLYWSYQVRVITEDRSGNIIYPLLSKGESPFVVLYGKRFEHLLDGTRQSVLFRCPRFERENGAITPQSVKDLIQWCLSDSEPRIRVNWKNQPI